MEKHLKHLEFIQAAIQRLALYSFVCKGWAVTAVGAVVALADDSRAQAAMIAACVAAAFAVLDAFYLRQERLFRCLYSQIAVAPDPNMGMDPSIVANNVPRTIRLVFSPPIILLYGSLIAAALAAAERNH